ncbi:MAG: C45 family peptidase, partial [Parabacteroides sp.]|nr:C45 family peptidase [Parabacteroides sp.]
MRKIGKIIVVACSVLLGLPLVLLLGIGMVLYFKADFLQPEVKVDLNRYKCTVYTDSLRVCDDSSLLLNQHGLWESHILGNSIDRGAKYGLLSKDLLQYQEDVFVQQIHEFIPSEWWVEFLHKLIVVFNRSMASHIPEAYREEIYAMSLSCSDQYNAYGPSYARQLNYHAAHDIGHAMQEYMLVGCSSFACWGKESETDDLLIGRNFDFYVGDNFARNKVILFIEPTEGHRFVSVSWPGMMGVLSGMNEKGLTVTINAAKGDIPVSSAMPISLLARHILQHAANIKEAYAIAQEFETFVSESLLIGSSSDGYAAIIEKTPQKIALYQSPDSRIVCTNHYQSDEFEEDEYNKENIETSDSPYRHRRMNELLDELSPIDTDDAARILRDRKGIGHTDIGLSNEKSINQFIAHHSVIFQPQELRMWVSTSPWQLGRYVCYDLDDVFGRSLPTTGSYVLEDKSIEADSLSLKNDYIPVCRYREQYKVFTAAIRDKQEVDEKFRDEFVSNNP